MAFTVVHYETKYGAKDGVATSWLEKLVQPITSGEESAGFAGLRVPVFLRRCGLSKDSEATLPIRSLGIDCCCWKVYCIPAFCNAVLTGSAEA